MLEKPLTEDYSGASDATHRLERFVKTKPTSADFFAGSGLVTEALKPYFDSVWANDICPKKKAVFCANHTDKVFKQGSITDVTGDTLPAHTLSWASFPCQDLSLAGNMEGIKSQRSGLVWQWLRILDETPRRPPVVVAENVVGLVSAKNGRHYVDLHTALEERGYSVGAVMLDAALWVPQSRPRIFVVGIRNDIPHDDLTANAPEWPHSKAIQKVSQQVKSWVWWRLPEPVERQQSLSDIIEMDEPFADPVTIERNLKLIPAGHKERMKVAIKEGLYVFPGYKRIRNGQQVLELRFDDIAGCLRTPNGGSSRQQLVIYRNGELGNRLLTVRETARLMGARDSYKLPGSYNDGYKAMGDAVAVPAARHLARYLLSPLAQRSMNQEDEVLNNELQPALKVI